VFGARGAVATQRQPLTGPACNPLFASVASPNSANAFNELESTAAILPTDIWAVGFSNSGAVNAVDQNLVEHYNGTIWSFVPVPQPGSGSNDLGGVAATDSNDVWAVGNTESGGLFQTLALHWNGVGWGQVATPNPGTGNRFLSNISVLAANDIWAVGAFQTGGNYQTLVLHWNGSAWSQSTSLNAGSGDNELIDVFARTSTDIWAVGFHRAVPGTGPRLTLLEHYDGTNWSIQATVDPVVGGDNVFFGVSALSPTDVWAVGYTNTLGGTPLRQTLIEHLVGTWMVVASPNIGTGDNVLVGLLTLSATNAWATGYGKIDTNPATGGSVLAEHYDGSNWTIRTADNGTGTGGSGIFGLAALAGNEVWGVGGSFTLVGSEGTLADQFQLPPPTAVVAVPGNLSDSVSWTAPAGDCGFTTTSWVVTVYDGCSVQESFPASTSPSIISVSNGSPFNFRVQAVSASLGAETFSAPSAPVTASGAAAPGSLSACSNHQYQYSSPDPTTFVDMDSTNLKLLVTPGADSLAIISGNSDLWTANAGLNQDIGINVSGGAFATGQVVGWKESGGFAGTFSPNAAAVQSVVAMTGGTTYTVKLQWKGNKSAPGASIFAGAGPLPGGSSAFSPTRLTVRLVTVASATVTTVFTTKQYGLTGSNGTTWADIDLIGLKATVTPAADSMAVITGNADLWTANAGFNQDIAINVDGSIAAWKESGGFAGTFSPNAATVQAIVPLLIAGSPHTIKLQWKTNKPAGGASIYAGAGPWPGSPTFSPTRLTVLLLPAIDVNSPVSTLQYSLPNSDGAGWTAIDNSALKATFAPGVTLYSYSFSGNVDLWTANAGFNQDIGIFISGGVYGAGTLVAWKESGGFAGTFSPNAAYVETTQHLQGGVSYTFWLAWKTNKPGGGSTIFAAAGPLTPSVFSPTRLAAVELSSP
jgi:hypothetical protein